MNERFSSGIINAAKWSSLSELMAKMVSPISTMVLARILTPDAFGVLITSTMIITFAEIFTDAGFQKYLIQHQFNTDEELYKSTSVAFWTNLALSIGIWGLICLFSSDIAYLVGNDGYGLVIAVSCICIPLESFSSIQMALFKRAMDFKTLFQVRVITIIIPIVVTIPIAFLTKSYWSLIIGVIVLNICNAVYLTFKSKWRINRFYDVGLFKEMFTFTAWSMVEAVSIWLTLNIDVFCVGSILNSYYMGLYKTSINLVNSIFSVIIASSTPVLFSALSRLQDNPSEFNQLFFMFQKVVGCIVIPLGVLIFLYSDVITIVLLGNQWTAASSCIGWWGLTSAFTIVLSHYSGEIYRAKGKPKLSFIAQLLHLMFLIPVIFISIRYGFECLYVSRSLIRFQAILVNMIILYKLINISPMSLISNVFPASLSCLSILVIYLFVGSCSSSSNQIAIAVLSIIIYMCIIACFPSERRLIKKFCGMLIKK